MEVMYYEYGIQEHTELWASKGRTTMMNLNLSSAEFYIL
jgi:hypothetical protein